MTGVHEQTSSGEAQKYFTKFLKTLWITKGARFEANRRLVRKNQLSLMTISILSIYVIAASLLPLAIPNLDERYLGVIPVATIVTSVFILVLSHIEAAKNYATRADRMLRCGEQVSEVHNELELQIKTETLTIESFRALKDRYDTILRDVAENHENVDFFYFMINHRKAFGLEGMRSLPKIYRHKMSRFINIWGFYLVVLILPPAVVLLMPLFARLTTN